MYVWACDALSPSRLLPSRTCRTIPTRSDGTTSLETTTFTLVLAGGKDVHARNGFSVDTYHHPPHAHHQKDEMARKRKELKHDPDVKAEIKKFWELV